MNKQNIRILSTIALVATLAAASASTASAAGLLGQRYAGATLDYVLWDDDAGLDDGLGATLFYNQPLNQSFDLTLGYSYLNSDIEGSGSSVDGHDISFGGRWFQPLSNGKVFVGAELGWSKASAGGFSDSTAYWGVAAGYEFPLGSSVTATPYLSFSDAFESGYSSEFEYGILGEFAVSDATSVIVKASGNDDSDFGFSGGFLFRF